MPPKPIPSRSPVKTRSVHAGKTRPSASSEAAAHSGSETKAGSTHSGASSEDESDIIPFQEAVAMEIQRRPTLRSLCVPEIRKFLCARNEWHLEQEAMGFSRTGLRAMIDPAMLPGIPRFVRLHNDIIPTDPLAPPRDAKSEYLTMWDEVLHTALMAAVSHSTVKFGRTYPEAEAVIRRKVRWDITRGSFEDTFNCFQLDFERALDENGVRHLLTTGSKASNRTVKLLNSLLYPEGFRTGIEEAVFSNDVRTVDG